MCYSVDRRSLVIGSKTTTTTHAYLREVELQSNISVNTPLYTFCGSLLVVVAFAIFHTVDDFDCCFVFASIRFGVDFLTTVFLLISSGSLRLAFFASEKSRFKKESSVIG